LLEFLSDKLGAGALIISQLLLTAVVGTNPYFEDVNLEVKGDRLFCSAQLMEGFTPDLDLLLQSGDTVVIHFEVDLVKSSNDSIVAMADWQHHFTYSLLEDDFSIYRSEIDKTTKSFSLDEAKEIWVKIDKALFCRMRVMEDGEPYYLKITAFLEEMEMPGITDRINLMSFWNRIRPVHVSESFEKRQLVK